MITSANLVQVTPKACQPQLRPRRTTGSTPEVLPDRQPRRPHTRPGPLAPSPEPETALMLAAEHASHCCAARPSPDSTRRSVLFRGACAAGAWLAGPPRPSHAALVRFPANQLNNRYYLVRAGESYNEAVGDPLTNPVWKTSEKHGLSERGKKQVLSGLLPDLEALGACSDGCWLWPSITQNAYQTAELIAYGLGIGRSRIVPEYSFLDARGVGALETQSLAVARQAVAEGDLLDPSWRPPPGTDGTPPESTSDVLVRMRQVLSITETQYFGEDVLLVAPDSDCLSVLQAGVLGLDLRQHRRFAFRPGEVRPLILSSVAFDASPRSFACPDPPKCSSSSGSSGNSPAT
ncbi:hypothetical protein PLESTF_001057200 [Pleodorina starrii]|nr:hypothetical protein PLESTM_001132100 [Pleodorina starrii]GLC70979.1 hypothetical protein PLESTF_001057200 [Pleodorina starrii]